NIFSGPGARISVLVPGYDTASRLTRQVQIEVKRDVLEEALKIAPRQGSVCTLRLVVGYVVPAGHRFADVSFVECDTGSTPIRMAGSPSYVGKHIEDFLTFGLATPWE